MGTAPRPATTPLAAVAGGFLAGVAGTACMDTVRYLMSRRADAKESLLRWEFGPIESWNDAPDPGQVARRVIEGFTQRKLPDRWAWRISTAAHWCYGSMWGSLYGVVAGSLRSPDPVYGLPFGAAVWASDYAVLPEAGLYKPIWKYDAQTLARDLGAHLAYGAATGTAFWLLTRLAVALTRRGCGARSADGASWRMSRLRGRSNERSYCGARPAAAQVSARQRAGAPAAR